MPIFEYICEKCGNEFEELVFSSSESVACSDCGSAKVKKALSVFSYSSGGQFHSSKGECGCGGNCSCSGGGCSSGGG